MFQGFPYLQVLVTRILPGSDVDGNTDGIDEVGDTDGDILKTVVLTAYLIIVLRGIPIARAIKI